MKTRLTPNTSAKKAVFLAIALAVVVGMSYLGSDEYLNQSIMEMLMGGTANPCTDSNCVRTGCKGGSTGCGNCQSTRSCPNSIHIDCDCPDSCGWGDYAYCSDNPSCKCPHND